MQYALTNKPTNASSLHFRGQPSYPNHSLVANSPGNLPHSQSWQNRNQIQQPQLQTSNSFNQFPSTKSDINNSKTTPTNTDRSEQDKSSSNNTKIATTDQKSWKDLWDTRFFGHWSYQNNTMLALIMLIGLNCFLVYKITKLTVEMEDLAASNSCRTSTIVEEIALELKLTQNAIAENLINSNDVASTEFRSELSKLSKSASKRNTALNEDLSYLGTRVSNLQAAVRNLARNTKESTIVPSNCRSEGSLEDEPAYF